MSEVQYEIEATLVVETPLHVGSGTTRTINSVLKTAANGAASNEHPDVAAIQRDAAGLPYLPPSSLKGLFRRLGNARYRTSATASGANDSRKTQDAAEAVALFGEISHSEAGTGRMGAILFRGASLDTSRAPDTGEMPYVRARVREGDTARINTRLPDDLDTLEHAGDLGPGVFVAGRTRIDRASGTVEDGKLFYQEMLAPDCRFPLRFRLAAGDNREQLLKDFIGLLSGLEDAPASLGKATGQGLGRVRIDKGSISVTELSLDPTTLEWRRKAVTPAASPARSSDTDLRRRDFRLSCPGPFMVLDSFGVQEAKRTRRQNDEQRAQLRASMVTKNLPLLLGTSLKGVLRSRAAWIRALDLHRAAMADGGAFDPAKVDDPDKVLKAGGDPAGLTPVERLFGVTGFKGLLSIRNLKVGKATPWEITSVKLDRFSGGPIDGGLFTSATFTGATLTFELALTRRGLALPDDIAKADEALFDALAGDIDKNGLMLGHGTNKGFGWFEVEGDAA
jgi:CRISPR/Cas system CSM-associated protein Csm3 (group 7 of RAMP superfamily)